MSQQIQLTTREAVEEALEALNYRHETARTDEKQEKTLKAAQLLCDLYGFKLEQFFVDGDEL
jgi:hypothetical protein